MRHASPRTCGAHATYPQSRRRPRLRGGAPRVTAAGPHAHRTQGDILAVARLGREYGERPATRPAAPVSTPPHPPPRDDGDLASQVAAAARLASGVVRMALWPVKEAVVAAERLERVARAVAGDLAGRVAVAVVDAVVASAYTERAVDHMLESPLAEHAVGRAMSGPLVEATARDLVDHAVVERVAEELLRAGVADRLADRILGRREHRACRRAHSRGSRARANRHSAGREPRRRAAGRTGP